MAKEDSDVLVVTAPISSTVSVGLTYFAVWVAQGPAEAEKIRAVHVSFASANADNVGKLLHETTLSKYGG